MVRKTGGAIEDGAIFVSSGTGEGSIESASFCIRIAEDASRRAQAIEEWNLGSE